MTTPFIVGLALGVGGVGGVGDRKQGKGRLAVLCGEGGKGGSR